MVSTLKQTVTELGHISMVLAKQEATLQRLAQGIDSLCIIKSPPQKIARTLPPPTHPDTTHTFLGDGSTSSYTNSKLYDDTIYKDEIEPPPKVTNLQ